MSKQPKARAGLGQEWADHRLTFVCQSPKLEPAKMALGSEPVSYKIVADNCTGHQAKCPHPQLTFLFGMRQPQEGLPAHAWKTEERAEAVAAASVGRVELPNLP